MNKKAPLPGIKEQAKKFRSLSLDEATSAVGDIISKLRQLDDYSTSDCSQDLQQLRIASSWGTNPEERDKLGQKMTSFGLPELFLKIWRPHVSNDQFLTTDPLWQNMDQVMVTMWNMTDKCTTLCQHSLNVGVHKDALSCLKSLDPEKSASPRCARVVKGMTGIMHNTLHRVPESRQPIRDEDAVQIIQRFRQSPDSMVACKALIVQAYLITEQENDAVNSDKKTFEFLLTLLVSAINSPEHKSPTFGFHAEETLVALNKLAANDSNKRRIVDCGFLPHYVRLLQPDCNVDEQVAAAEGLWILAFKCPDDIRKEPDCLNSK